jgi:hypothetical protein
MKHPTRSTPAEAIQLAADITKACTAAGVRDAAEIPALIDYAHAAEQFNKALTSYQLAQHAYNRFIATHGADDPGQDYYVQQVTAAREIYNVAICEHHVALEAWRIARGLATSAALAA